MLAEHRFKHDGLTYRCFRMMTAPATGLVRGDTPRMAYWDVARSDGAGRRVWALRGQEFDAAGLEATTLEEFGVSDS